MHTVTPSTKDLKTAIKRNGFSLLINHDTIENHTTLHRIWIKQYIDLTINTTFV